MSMRNRSPNRRGLSLIELVVVILLIAILAATAVSRYSQSMDRFRADSAARRIAADLRLAADEARRTSSVRQVQFNAAGDTYTLPNVGDLDDAGQTYSIDLAGSEYASDLTSADFGGSSNASFDMYGRPVNGGAVSIESNGEARTITLNADGSTTVP